MQGGRREGHSEKKWRWWEGQGSRNRCRANTHSFQDADGLLAEPDRVEHVIVEDGLKQVVLVVGLEGGLPSHHLVHQHPQRPPVHRGAVLQLLQDLIRRRTASEPSRDARLQPRLCHKCPWAEWNPHFQFAPPQSRAPSHVTSANSVTIEFGRHSVGSQPSAFQGQFIQAVLQWGHFSGSLSPR